MGDLNVLPFVVAVPAYVVIGFTIFDAARRTDLSVAKKALWFCTAALLPVLGTILYLLNRPFDDPAGGSAMLSVRASDLMNLVREREAGLIVDGEFTAEKRRIFAGVVPQVDP